MITYDSLLILGSIALLGLLFGSFVTMASYRIPLDQEIIFRRSHCTACNHNLTFSDLIPVLSWLIHQGKCAYCRTKVSARYPLIEIIVSLLFLIVYGLYGISFMTVILCLTAVCLMILIVTDFEHYIIPDKIYIALLPLALIFSLINEQPLVDSITGGVIGLSAGIMLRWLMWVWKKQEGLGLGDVKFLGIVGCFLGPTLIAPFLFLSGILGIITALLWQALGKGKLFPFGPALATALFICLLIPAKRNLFEDLHQLATTLLKGIY